MAAVPSDHEVRTEGGKWLGWTTAVGNGEVVGAEVAGMENPIVGVVGRWESSANTLCGKPAELVGREVDSGGGLDGTNGVIEATVVGGKDED